MVRGRPREDYGKAFLGMTVASLPMIALGPVGLATWAGCTLANGLLGDYFSKKEEKFNKAQEQ
jgi:hypothetical protein